MPIRQSQQHPIVIFGIARLFESVVFVHFRVESTLLSCDGKLTGSTRVPIGLFRILVSSRSHVDQFC
jgi:hypothetical protein